MINYEQWCRLKQLAERDRLSAAQIARALGLAARTVRKWRKEPYLTLSFAPGECAQVDWGQLACDPCG